jgi:hypothetical protein
MVASPPDGPTLGRRVGLIAMRSQSAEPDARHGLLTRTRRVAVNLRQNSARWERLVRTFLPSAELEVQVNASQDRARSTCEPCQVPHLHGIN